MKTDEESGEADEPPEEPPCSECNAKKSEREENEELQWARRHVPEGYSGPSLVFRKTELHDRPPGSRAYQAATAPATGRTGGEAERGACAFARRSSCAARAATSPARAPCRSGNCTIVPGRIGPAAGPKGTHAFGRRAAACRRRRARRGLPRSTVPTWRTAPRGWRAPGGRRPRPNRA